MIKTRILLKRHGRFIDFDNCHRFRYAKSDTKILICTICFKQTKQNPIAKHIGMIVTLYESPI